MDAFVARQPIFDGEREVYGYELLFRSGPENYFSAVDGDRASSSLMSDSMSVHGLHKLTGGRRAFVNVTRRILVDQLFAVLPPAQTVIEVLETVDPDAEVLEACRSLREAGYLLALDDFVLDDRYDELLPQVDILKIDFSATSAEGRREFAEEARLHDFVLLAEKVETYEQFNEAADLGYTYFQGYFFCKPEMISTKQIPGLKLTYLRFLEEINRPWCDLDNLEDVIRQDVSLSFRLLKYLNSAAFGLRNKVGSIKHALTLLGSNSLKKWASLIAMTTLGDDKPHELVLTSLNRARLCELIGAAAGRPECEDDLFLVGLFSVVDALVDRPMADVLKEISLDPDIAGTLMDSPTELTDVLQLVRALERGEWDRINEFSRRLNISGDKIMQLHRTAIEWAAGIGGISSEPDIREVG